MLKSIGIAVLALLIAVSWHTYVQSEKEEARLKQKVEKLQCDPSTEQEVREIKKKISGMEGERIFMGILLTFLSAGLIGIVFTTLILPMLADKVSVAIYASDEKAEIDPLHLARVKMAQGEWDDAIEAFNLASQKNPNDRMPWIEIAKIQRHNLENPPAAIATLRQAIENHEWQEDDMAFLMFRLSEIYEEDFQDHDTAGAILSQIIELFPDTRHSANARTKTRKWGLV
jgi:tetratricopeptide (TPR) repeat protein